MNRKQKEFLLLGYDFSKYINISQYHTLYFNEYYHATYYDEDPMSKPPYDLAKNDYVDLSHLHMGDYASNLSEFDFSKTRSLNLFCNHITDISFLSKSNLISLEELNLALNDIKDISILTEIKLPNLKIIDLRSNNYQDTSVLANINANDNLEIRLYSSTAGYTTLKDFRERQNNK